MTVVAAVSSRADVTLDVGLVFVGAVSAAKRNWRVLTGLSVLMYGLPYGLLDWIIYQFHIPLTWQTYLVSVSLVRAPFLAICSSWLSAAVTTVIAVDRTGRRASFKDAIGALAPVWSSLLLLCVIRAVVLGIGYVLLVPMLMFAIIWPLVAPMIVFERASTLPAFRKSAFLTRRYRWPLFWTYIAFNALLWIVGTAIAYGSAFSFQALASNEHVYPQAFFGLQRALTTGLAESVAGGVGEVWAATLYFQLRALKEGIAPEVLASVFD